MADWPCGIGDPRLISKLRKCYMVDVLWQSNFSKSSLPHNVWFYTDLFCCRHPFRCGERTEHFLWALADGASTWHRGSIPFLIAPFLVSRPNWIRSAPLFVDAPTLLCHDPLFSLHPPAIMRFVALCATVLCPGRPIVPLSGQRCRQALVRPPVPGEKACRGMGPGRWVSPARDTCIFFGRSLGSPEPRRTVHQVKATMRTHTLTHAHTHTHEGTYARIRSNH